MVVAQAIRFRWLGTQLTNNESHRLMNQLFFDSTKDQCMTKSMFANFKSKKMISLNNISAPPSGNNNNNVSDLSPTPSVPIPPANINENEEIYINIFSLVQQPQFIKRHRIEYPDDYTFILSPFAIYFKNELIKNTKYNKLLTKLTQYPTAIPSSTPNTRLPSNNPSFLPTFYPSTIPTVIASLSPITNKPTKSPITNIPTINPTKSPTQSPNNDPTTSPITLYPTINPSKYPTKYPTLNPSYSTLNPTKYPTIEPTINPTIEPTKYPTIEPTIDETESEVPYKVIDRYPVLIIGGIIAFLIIGALFFCFCIFIIWRCKKFESKEHAKKLEAEYREEYAKKYGTNHSDHEEGIDIICGDIELNNINLSHNININKDGLMNEQYNDTTDEEEYINTINNSSNNYIVIIILKEMNFIIKMIIKIIKIKIIKMINGIK